MYRPGRCRCSGRGKCRTIYELRTWDYWFAVLENELQRGQAPIDALVRATADTAAVYDIGPTRCEHGIKEGDWCEPCNLEYELAEVENK